MRSGKFAVLAGAEYRSKVLAIALSVLPLMTGCGGGGGSEGTGPTSPTNGGPVPNTVSGTVTFKGAPLAGVTITAFNNNSDPSTIFASTVSDANGNYTISNFSTGCSCISNYSLVANKTGYAFNPFMADNPTGIRTAYVWTAPPQNWQVPTGANATRAGFNASFSNPNGGAAIMFNTIDFNSVTNNSISGADFSAYDGTNPLVTLAATGQTMSYTNGDDGAARSGIAWPATRYIDNQNGTVSDALTGLVWLKTAGCLASTAVAQPAMITPAR